MSMAFHATRAVAAKKTKRNLLQAAAKAAGATEQQPRLNFLSARRKLADFGIKALLPSVKPKYRDGEQDVSKLSVKERVWHPPMISKRQINVLRKQARFEGTYGSFDPETLRGWDPQWDIQLAIAKPHGTGRYTYLRVPKKTRQQRSREDRAQKIEAHMEGMDERMEALQAERHAKKEPDTIMNKYKKLMKESRK